MLRLSQDTKIYVADRPIDFRNAINGLSMLVLERFSESATSGSVYVFYNRHYDQVKCLFWEKNGFVLYQKRLERGRFKIKKEAKGSYTISQQQLDWLLAGLDFALMDAFSELDYTHYF
jgi:transposase